MARQVRTSSARARSVAVWNAKPGNSPQRYVIDPRPRGPGPEVIGIVADDSVAGYRDFMAVLPRGEALRTYPEAVLAFEHDLECLAEPREEAHASDGLLDSFAL